MDKCRIFKQSSYMNINMNTSQIRMRSEKASCNRIHSICHSCKSFFFFFPLCHVACGILVPQPGIKPPFPGLEKWSLNPWNTREVSHLCKSLIIISIMDTFIGTKSMKMGIGRILMSKEAGNWA